MMILDKRWASFFLLLLASLTPILSILINNLSILNGKIILTGFLFFSLNVFFTLFFKKIFNFFFDQYKSISLSIVTLFLFYFFSEIRDFSFTVQKTFLFLDWRVIFISFYVMLYILIFLLNSRFIYLFLVFFVVMNFVVLLFSLATPHPDARTTSKPKSSLEFDSPFQNIEFRHKPNVYVITVDGYGRQDKLKKYLGLSNDLIPFLQASGYTIIEDSRSNYPLTFLSLASTFTGTYLFKEGQQFYSRGPLYDIIGGNNPVAHTFQENGYLLVHGEGGAHDVANCSNPKAVCIKKSLFEVGSFPYEAIESKISPEFLGVILNKTPLYILNNFFINNIVVTIDQIVRNIDNIRKDNPKSPIYLYAYTIPPHPPFVFNADCSLKRIFKNKKNLGDSKDKQGYLDNLKCTNKNIMSFVNYINETDPTAIVVFFSDHGTDFSVDWMKDPQEWSKESVEERFSNMIAVKFPQKCRARLPKTMSNINIFHQIFSCLSEKEIKNEDDRYFVTIYENTPFEGKFVEKHFKKAR